MDLLYSTESFSEYFCSKKHDRNIQHKYDIQTIGVLTYSCKSIENHCWLQLIHTENNNHSSNEPKIVLAFVNYSGDHTRTVREDGIIFYLYLGRSSVY
jgi:hypothetical protein